MADNVWKNSNASTTTSWSADGDTSTSWEETNGSGSLIVDNSEQESTIGTFSSVAKAATSILGSKYHLHDDKEFLFGTDSDFRLDYSASNDGMVLNSSANSTSDKVFSLQNQTNEIFGITYEGVLKLKNISSLDTTVDRGRIAFAGNALFVSTD